MKKLICFALVLIMIVCTFSTQSYAAVSNDTLYFPPSDGIDIGVDEETGIEPAAFWYSKYNYNATSFSVGVYMNNGASFACRKTRSPYLENACHDKTQNAVPSVYRVSYQMIYSSTGEVRKGVFFAGPINNLKIEFDVNETDNFKFYIAGESQNTYYATGTLRY